MEIWKSIKEYDGLYEVSNYGHIRSLDRQTTQNNNGTVTTANYKGQYLRGHDPGNGYRVVCLSKDGHVERRLVHRIVAETFCFKPEGCNIVNHLDCNRGNNRADNLEWTTHKGNMQWASSLGRMHANEQAYRNLESGREKRKTPVIATAPNGEESYFPTQVDAANALKVSRGHIAAACRKEYGYKTLHGYSFRYANEEKHKNAVPQKIGKSKEELTEEKRKRMFGNKLMVGRKLSDATKKKLSIANGSPVNQYDLDGNLVNSYVSTNEAYHRTRISHISDCAKGLRKTAGGYVWKLKQKEA